MSKLFSRREFLKQITGKEKQEGKLPVLEFTKSPEDDIEPTNREVGQGFQEKLSRRTVLEFLVGASLILTLPELFPKSDQGKDQSKTKEDGVGPVEHFSQSIDWQKFDQELSKDSAYTEAIAGQALVRIASEVGERILNDLKIKNGNLSLSNKDIEQMLEKAPLESYVRAVIVGPIIEEWVFRLMPSALADRFLKRKDTIWELGIPLTMVFAWMHNVEKIEVGGNTTHKLRLDSIPLNQFMSGLFFWYLMRKKGFNHAALAHMFNNNASYVLAKFFGDHFPWDSEKTANG